MKETIKKYNQLNFDAIRIYKIINQYSITSLIKCEGYKNILDKDQKIIKSKFSSSEFRNCRIKYIEDEIVLYNDNPSSYCDKLLLRIPIDYFEMTDEELCLISETRRMELQEIVNHRVKQINEVKENYLIRLSEFLVDLNKDYNKINLKKKYRESVIEIFDNKEIRLTRKDDTFISYMKYSRRNNMFNLLDKIESSEKIINFINESVRDFSLNFYNIEYENIIKNN